MKGNTKARTLSTAVVCPIVYGSVAVHLGKKSEEYSTHRWKLYVRGPNNEDLSSFVQKVAFTLHPSFAEPIREVKRAPFEVSETGWGEFEASIRIYFKDPSEQPLDLFHLIKLYPSGPPQLSGSLKKPAPVVAEQYDEIVFREPTELFMQQLMAYSSRETKPVAQLQIEGVVVPGTLFDDSLDLERLSSIHDHVLREVDAAKNRLLGLQAQVLAVTQQRRAEQRAIKAQQQQGDGHGDGSEEGTGELAGGSGAAASVAAGKRSAAGTKSAGSKAAAGAGGGTGTGTGSAPKRSRPSSSAASANQQAVGSASGSSSKKAAAAGTAQAHPANTQQQHQQQPTMHQLQQMQHQQPIMQQQMQHFQQQQQQQMPYAPVPSMAPAPGNCNNNTNNSYLPSYASNSSWITQTNETQHN